MSESRPVARPELVRWYEDLRAQATGQIPAATPRGLHLLLSSGLPAWMAACPPMTPPELAPEPAAGIVPPRSLAGLGAEVVSVLTEMALALAAPRRCAL